MSPPLTQRCVCTYSISIYIINRAIRAVTGYFLKVYKTSQVFMLVSMLVVLLTLLTLISSMLVVLLTLLTLISNIAKPIAVNNVFVDLASPQVNVNPFSVSNLKQWVVPSPHPHQTHTGSIDLSGVSISRQLSQSPDFNFANPFLSTSTRPNAGKHSPIPQDPSVAHVDRKASYKRARGSTKGKSILNKNTKNSPTSSNPLSPNSKNNKYNQLTPSDSDPAGFTENRPRIDSNVPGSPGGPSSPLRARSQLRKKSGRFEIPYALLKNTSKIASGASGQVPALCFSLFFFLSSVCASCLWSDLEPNAVSCQIGVQGALRGHRGGSEADLLHARRRHGRRLAGPVRRAKCVISARTTPQCRQTLRGMSLSSLSLSLSL